MQSIPYGVKRKGASFGPKVKVGKQKTKVRNVFSSSIAHSLRGLELSYLNFKKVLYTASLNSNNRALALILSEHLKKKHKKGLNSPSIK